MPFLGKSIGWGVVIYALIYLLWSGLVLYGLSLGIFSITVRVLALILVTTIAARSLHLATRMDVLPYSIGWAVVAMALDAIFLLPLSGTALYAEWGVWLGYALVALLPLLTFRLRATRAR